MNELQASLSPTTLPCNSETDPADVRYSDLQLTVVNVSGAAIPELELQIEFVVDPAGTTGTQTSLVLAEYSTDVSGAPALGINWTVTSSQDAPCTFLVSPNSGQMQAGEQAVFLFSSIAVDLAQGVSQVTVIALSPAGVTVQSTPAVTKAPPVLTANLTPSPLNLTPGQPGPAGLDYQTLLTWSTVGAGECTLGWDQASAQVSYNGNALEYNPQNPSQVPLQATGEPDSPPVIADLFDTTEFTLTATGTATATGTPTFTSSQNVTVQPAKFWPSAFPGGLASYTVSPYDPFTLNWQCLMDSGPTLTWQSEDPNAVFSITGSNGQPITSNVTQLNPWDWASVIIISAVTFTLTMNSACQAVPTVTVGVSQVQLTGFTGSAEIMNTATGQQAANLTWSAVNVIGFTLSGEDGLTGAAVPIAVGNLSYTARNTTVNLPLVTFPGQPWPQPDPVTFTLTAQGYNASTLSCTVEPVQVSLASFTASTYTVGWGEPVTLQWSAVAATGFTLGQTVAGTTLPSQTFQANLQSWPTPKLYTTTTFEITAYGYMPAGDAFPTATLTVEVGRKPKEKIEGKEYKERSKEDLAELPQVQPDASAADLPSGSEQAFIGSDERPDVGVDLAGGPDDEQS